MNKNEALKIILNCAKLYKDNLENKNLLIISEKQDKNLYFIEAKFLGYNFLHLTGVAINKKITANSFYNKCLNRRLSLDDFDFKSDGTTILKLQVLPQIMKISKNANMIGEYNGSKPKLYTDKLAGNVVGCIGLKIDSNYYVPVTVLKEDMRNLVVERERVILIFSKSIKSKLYNNLVYMVKDIGNLKQNLSNKLLMKIDIDNLTNDFGNRFVKKCPITEMILKEFIQEDSGKNIG